MIEHERYQFDVENAAICVLLEAGEDMILWNRDNLERMHALVTSRFPSGLNFDQLQAAVWVLLTEPDDEVATLLREVREGERETLASILRPAFS